MAYNDKDQTEMTTLNKGVAPDVAGRKISFDMKNLQTVAADRKVSIVPKELSLLAEIGSVPEGGWGWAIVFSIFLLMTVLFGYVFSLSVFFVEWLQYFDASATELSWVMSLAPAVAGVLSPVAGGLCTKFGSRRVALVGSVITIIGAILAVFSKSVTHLYITIGVIVGGGSSLTFSPSLVLLGHYFQRRYVLANSIAFCGYSCAQIFIPRLTQLLIEEYGWRGALLIQAGMLSHLFVCSSLLRPRIQPKPPKNPVKESFPINIICLPTISQPKAQNMYTSTSSLDKYDNLWDQTNGQGDVYREKHAQDDNQPVQNAKLYNPLSSLRAQVIGFLSFFKETYGISALGKSVLYLVTVFSSFAGGVGWFITNGHLVNRAVSGGISPNNAAFLMTLLGIGSFIGRAGHGIVIDKGWVSRQVVFTVSFGMTGVLSLINPQLDTFVLLGVYGVVFGLTHGIANSLVFAMMKLQVARSEAAAALSFGTLVLACSNTMGGVMGGVLYDATGNYDVSFYFAAAMILLGTFVLSIVFIINHFKKPRYNPRGRRYSRRLSIAIAFRSTFFS